MSIFPTQQSSLELALRRERAVGRAADTVARLQRRLQAATLNLDAVRQYRSARPSGCDATDATFAQLEANLQTEIDGCQKRITTTEKILRSLQGVVDFNDGEIAISQLQEMEEPENEASEEHFEPSLDTSTCLNPESPASGEFSISSKALMGQVIRELDFKFRQGASHNLIRLDEDDYSSALEQIDVSASEGLEEVEEVQTSVRCGLVELCHRVAGVDNGRPEAVLDLLHLLNTIAATVDKTYVRKKRHLQDQ
ncbi:Hypothetical predicted protein [Cloeon dipterum]|uniref:Uncharacterized protein n=1 Tax=Cloeon dipterum TaxID=197152 RepID=A0A8S1DAF5_9INSE|nr:Hypothetical predicted protein [Cloeon dipterum]